MSKVENKQKANESLQEEGVQVSHMGECVDPQEIMEGLLPLNLGALFMPPIWGPAHGIWLTILYYPAWIFADDLFYTAYSSPTAVSVVLSVLAALILAAVTIVFARAGQEHACRRAILEQGKTKQEYRAYQKIWAIGMGVVAVIFIVLATYYNLVIRPNLGV